MYSNAPTQGPQQLAPPTSLASSDEQQQAHLLNANFRVPNPSSSSNSSALSIPSIVSSSSALSGPHQHGEQQQSSQQSWSGDKSGSVPYSPMLSSLSHHQRGHHLPASMSSGLNPLNTPSLSGHLHHPHHHAYHHHSQQTHTAIPPTSSSMGKSYYTLSYS